ncbi:hypothetical protein AWE51_12415 [Aquimarina aggregata]|uniref:DUF3857 domain-containing protein n=1 Tax=Aquimarina aggregata TaxID=1642818 RepID=A0A162YT55_9FLAO|nr:DUF3857 domain-containing protein [Aquimarina aggregata]KZS39339.1 hypothetical protein AWE51_12415 [Aquimarina aggregata]
MKKIILLFLYTLVYLNGFGQKNKISISKTPEWVQIIEKTTTKNKKKETTSGYYYHIIDFQNNIRNNQSFSHYNIEVINNEGIQQVSDLSVDFDPSYQKLVFHSINIIRDGSIINKLSYDQIKTVQRETNMERYLYDGTLTAFVNLTDVRKGDFIDYSFTIKGRNPVYENKYHNKLVFQYSIPIGYLFNRLVVPSNRELSFKYFNDADKPKIKKSEKITEYLWEHDTIEPIIYDTNTPSWYDPIPSVSISEYNSWKEVVDQYTKHYTFSSIEQKKLKKEVSKLFSDTPKDSLLTEIRKFVQDEIRYLGFEGGLNSHKPDNPLKVIKQRYGDCKAKSFLLSEILRNFDFEANPILVNSYNGTNIVNELPSPNVFNHCIVQVKKNDQSYFIDPTISNQGGNIDNLYVPNYTTGLILNTSERELSKIKSASENTIKITEEFDIEEIGSTAYLFITTKYSGSYADDQRINFAQKDIEKIQKEYLNFYSAIYPSIREFSKIEFIDNRESINEVTIKEGYFIDSLWKASTQNKDILVSEFYPLNMESYANPDKTPKRTMPYYVQYPVDFEQSIVINLPEDLDGENERTVIEEKSFKYIYDIDYSYKKITLRHQYKTLKNHVKPEESNKFIKKHEKILNGLSYLLTYDKNIASGSSSLSWYLIIFGIFILITSLFFAYRIYANYNIKVEESINNPLQIGGWLILISIGLILTPFKVIFQLFNSYEDFFGNNTWNYIIQDHKNLNELFYSLLVLLELTYNIVLVVFSILLIILFFKRRNILPRLMIIFYVGTFLFLTFDSIIAFNLNTTLFTEAEKVQTFKEIGTSFIRSIIWVPYFLISKRVKSTFTLRIKEKNNDT